MKKLVIAGASALLFGGAALAQSSVTMFGVVDTNIGFVNTKNGTNVSGMGSGGRTTSRLGLRGSEDLGSGLKANFWLEGAIFGDDGRAGSLGTGSLDFRRRSIVGLSGGFGEVRLGRDLVPSFSGTSKYDPWNTTGMAHFQGWTRGFGVSNGPEENGVRADNMVLYTSPGFGGFKFSVAYAFDEKRPAGTKTNGGRYAGGNAGYDNGPISVTLTAAQQKTSMGVLAADRDEIGLGGSYDLGVAKLGAIFMQTNFKPEIGTDRKFSALALNGVVPVGGNGAVIASYALYDDKATTDGKTHQFSVGYDYNLSKRTTMYSLLSHINNKKGAAMTVGSNKIGAPAPAAGDNQTGLQVGIRHMF